MDWIFFIIEQCSLFKRTARFTVRHFVPNFWQKSTSENYCRFKMAFIKKDHSFILLLPTGILVYDYRNCDDSSVAWHRVSDCDANSTKQIVWEHCKLLLRWHYGAKEFSCRLVYLLISQSKTKTSDIVQSSQLTNNIEFQTENPKSTQKKSAHITFCVVSIYMVVCNELRNHKLNHKMLDMRFRQTKI